MSEIEDTGWIFWLGVHGLSRIATVPIFFFVWCLGLWSPAVVAEPLKVVSPDGNLALSFQLKFNPQPYLPGERAYYRVSYKGIRILRDSPLGLDFLGEPALDRDFEVIGTSRRSHDENWQNPFGSRRNVQDHYNELRVSLRERKEPHRRLDLIFRAYDGGVAFRYFLPKQPELEKFTLTSENTGFYFSHQAFAYASSGSRYLNAYETQFRRADLSEIKPTTLAVLPLLVEVPHGPWVAILEADLHDYAGMYLGGVPGIPNALATQLASLPDQFYEQHFHLIYFSTDHAVVGSAPKGSPWRVLLINPRPRGLIESADLILNLNPPSVLRDPSWIKPGKVAWSWWSGNYATDVNFTPGMNTATLEHYIDFAAAHHLEYALIDGGWSPRDDITHWVPAVDVPEVLAHARSKGVKVILWAHWENTKKQIDTAFPLYQEWGVAGVKIDFMNRDDQEMVDSMRKWRVRQPSTTWSSTSTAPTSPLVCAEPIPTCSPSKAYWEWNTARGPTSSLPSTTSLCPLPGCSRAQWTIRRVASTTPLASSSSLAGWPPCAKGQGPTNWPCTWSSSARFRCFPITPSLTIITREWSSSRKFRRSGTTPRC